MRGSYRRRMIIEEKANVVTSDWEEEFFQFLAVPAALPRTILNNRINCTRMIRKKKMRLEA